MVGLFAAPGTGALGRDLVRCLARRVDVRAGARLAANGSAGSRPDAVLLLDAGCRATVPAAWRVLPTATLEPGPPRLTVAAPAADEAVSGSASGDATTTVRLPQPWVIAEDLLPVPPLVRARRRRRDGLPPDLIALLTGDQAGDGVDPGDAVVLLQLAAAAVVGERWLPTALALGTPTVTTATAATGVGAVHGRHVLVVGGEADASGASLLDAARQAAGRLGRDEALAARLSREALSIRPRLDLGRAVEELLGRLDLDAGGEGTLLASVAEDALPATAAGRVAAELTRLGSLAGTPQTRRALAAVASLDAGGASPPS